MKCCDISPGKLNKKMVLESPHRTEDGQGGYISEWRPLKTIWAQLRPTSGNERLRAGRIEHVVTHRVIIRYSELVTAQQRFTLGNRIFDIVDLINIEEKDRWLECTVIENAPT